MSDADLLVGEPLEEPLKEPSRIRKWFKKLYRWLFVEEVTITMREQGGDIKSLSEVPEAIAKIAREHPKVWPFKLETQINIEAGKPIDASF